jgi:inward rectifier potassium channel
MAPWRRRSARSFSTTPVRLQKHGGIFSAVNPTDWIRHWRYPNHLMLAVPWPVFFGLIAAGYLLLNLLFSLLYWIDPHGIAGVAGATTSFAEAFFFSVQTLGSIGYGALHPASLFTNLIVTVESLLGLIVIALMTGMAFSRFSRSTARILFSEEATVHTYNGLPTLMFRLANERRKAIIEAQLRAYLAIDERSAEGQRMRRLLPLNLLRDHSPLFLLTWTVMHPIDPQSPLLGATANSLQAANAEIVISFSGIDEILERPIHAHHHYPLAQVHFDHRFVDMMIAEDDMPPQLEFANFNQIEPC